MSSAPSAARPAFINLRVAEPAQLLHPLDPAPPAQRALAPEVEAFILESARELPERTPLALVLHLDRAGNGDEAPPGELAGAVRRFFTARAARTRTQLRRLVRLARLGLLFSLVLFGVALGLGEGIEALLPGRRAGEVFREGLISGGWVAMWRPMEILLFDRLTLRAEARLLDRLGAMDVQTGGATGGV
ncbi:MAG TPA: hypothetical protein PKE47_11640 [Verrucomicrobiota bacterium]|nr:hypothetical protein [Verrucomicrobiota bacterium]